MERSIPWCCASSYRTRLHFCNAGDDGKRHRRRAGGQKRSRAPFGRGACGQHVINQNDPPADDDLSKSGITASLVRNRLSLTPRNVAPVNTIALTAFIDIGKYYCHFAVTAWMAGARGIVIDYGVAEVHNAEEVGVENAILKALRLWRDQNLAEPYVDANGEPRRVDLVLIDSGYCDAAVFAFVREAGKPFRASKGFGAGPGRAPFRQPTAAQRGKRVGDHWFEALQSNGQWLVGMDADHWKRWCHDRLLTLPLSDDGLPRDGSLTLFGKEQREHIAFSKHVTAEEEIEEMVKGKGVKRYWKLMSRNNHWFDATWGCCAAAAIMGVKLHGESKANAQSAGTWFKSRRK